MRSIWLGILGMITCSGAMATTRLCDTALKDDMIPGQVKIIDCALPEYEDLCYNDVKLQAVYLDYDGNCEEYEYECATGFQCAKSSGHSYFECVAGDGSAKCPDSYTFQDRCSGLDDDVLLKAQCDACTFTDYRAWDYENKTCGAGVKDATGRVKQIVKEMDSLLTRSHWRDKNGNFNTARLASDSIAGVVLGTAGGLITSQIIKSNQVKGGFEDIQCTISGQVVSGYGDEFMVGIK